MDDEAAASLHFTRGNALIRELRPFDIKTALAEFDDVRRAFAEVEPPPLDSPTGPVFIVGLPRSGKTTLEAILARHPAFFPAGELSVVGNLSSGVHLHGGDGAKALGRRYLAMAEALAPGRRILDTMPNNFISIGLLRLALPGARVLHCTRDPADHARALPRKLYLQSGNDYANNPADLAAYMAAYRELMSFWRQRFPGFILDVDGTQLAAVTEFLGVAWDRALAQPYVSEPRLPAAN